MRRYVKSDYEATIPQDMLYNPDGGENSIRDYFRQRGADDKKAREDAESRAAMQKDIDALKAKYPESEITAIRESAESNQLDELFELVVPSSGMCDSVGGEIVRAMTQILYRNFNDGDVFYEGYGKETCMPSVKYLCDVIPWAYDDFSDIAESELRGGAYTRAISRISEEICWELLYDNINLFWTPNDVDSRYFESSKYSFSEPEYEYEGDFPDSLVEALAEGKVSESQIEEELEWSLSGMTVRYEGFDIGEYGFTVYGLDRDSYDELSWQGEAIGNDIADDLLSDIDDEDW